MFKRTCFGFALALVASALVVIGCAGGGSSVSAGDANHDAKLMATWLMATLQTTNPATGPSACPKSVTLANTDTASCAASENVVFNADGTYSHSVAGVVDDTGTWTSAGNALTITSTTPGGGGGVVNLEWMVDAAGTTLTVMWVDANAGGSSDITMTATKV